MSNAKVTKVDSKRKSTTYMMQAEPFIVTDFSDRHCLDSLNSIITSFCVMDAFR